jgi:CheY-like chemotaxis protein
VPLDLKLSEFGGADLLQYTKRRHPAPVIDITGRPLKSTLHDALPPGDKGGRAALELADEFVEKPFEVETVLSSIRRLILQ